MNLDGPVIVAVFGAPRGLRLAAAISALQALNEERGVIVAYALDGEPYKGIRTDFDAIAVDEFAHCDPIAFRRLCESLPQDVEPIKKQYIDNTPPKNKPWYRHNQRW